MVLHHVKEGFEHSRRKRNRRPIQPPQEPFSCIELKPAELVNGTGSSLDRSFQIIQKKFSRSLKTFISALTNFRPRRFGSHLPAQKRKIHKKQ